jgi:hypothetical protein
LGKIGVHCMKTQQGWWFFVYLEKIMIFFLLSLKIITVLVSIIFDGISKTDRNFLLRNQQLIITVFPNFFLTF